MLKAIFKKKFSSYTLSVDLSCSGRTALIGPSGCGKSVTLKCIAGIMRPDEGHIEYNGQVLYDSASHIDLPPRKRKIGYLFQNYALFPDMSVRENIMSALHWQKDKADRGRIFNEVVDMVQIGHVLDSKPGRLSGGEAQRAALARMIVNQPSLMLFDEPFSALDVYLRSTLQAQFIQLMERLDKDHVIVTHSMDEACALSDRLYILDQGRVLREGGTRDVFQDPLSIKAAEIAGQRNITAARVEDGMLQVPGWDMVLPCTRNSALAVAIAPDDVLIDECGRPGRVLRRIGTPSGTSLLVLINGTSQAIWVSAPSGCDITQGRFLIPRSAIKVLTCP